MSEEFEKKIREIVEEALEGFDEKIREAVEDQQEEVIQQKIREEIYKRELRKKHSLEMKNEMGA